jgi:hypothetical protein
MQLIEQLSCKPVRDERIVYEQNTLLGHIGFYSLDLEKDIPAIHNWVNQPYAETFWQMKGSLPLLKTCYYNLLQNPFAHSFTAWHNRKMVAQLDVYQASQDPIATCIKNLSEGDAGFHLLMSPNTRVVHGLTTEIVKTFLYYYFSATGACRMFAEPDVNNVRSQHILEKLHFENNGQIELSYKKAYLFVLTKDRFLSFR